MAKCAEPATSSLCIAAISFSFPGRDQRSEQKSGQAKEYAWGEQKIGEKWEGGEREGGRGGEKRNCLQSIPNILPNSVQGSYSVI